MTADQKESQVWQASHQPVAEEMSLKSRSSRATWRGRSQKREPSKSGTPRACTENGALRAAEALVSQQDLFALCRMLINANEFVYLD